MTGHRKIAVGAATFAAGEVIGKDLLIWLWSIVSLVSDGMIGAMPEAVAVEIVTLLAGAAFYWTPEDRVTESDGDAT